MANKKPERKELASYEETDAFLKEMQRFREKAIDYAFKWAMASPERQASEVLLTSIDQFALALTGQERFYSSGSLETMIRQRRGWSA